LELYYNKTITGLEKGDVTEFAKKLIWLSSDNFSDKGKFTGIPSQTMMLGEAFVAFVKELKIPAQVESLIYQETFNLCALFEKFTEKKFDMYFIEKNKADCTARKEIEDRKLFIWRHMITALISLFLIKVVSQLLKGVKSTDYVKDTTDFFKSGEAYKHGMINRLHRSHTAFYPTVFCTIFYSQMAY
jgi:hypothetical protein